MNVKYYIQIILYAKQSLLIIIVSHIPQCNGSEGYIDTFGMLKVKNHLIYFLLFWLNSMTTMDLRF